MRSNRFIFSVIYSAIILFFISCNKEEYKTPTGFSVTGKVYIVEENSSLINKDSVASYINVYIENKGYNTITDSLGFFSFENIPYGSYSLYFEKEGYSLLKANISQEEGLNGVWKGIHLDEFLFEKSSTSLISDISINDLIISTTLSPAATNDFNRGIAVFIDSTENVAFDKNLYCKSDVLHLGDNVSVEISEQELFDSIPNFDSQKTYYAIAYGISKNFDENVAKYYNTEKQSFVYHGTNETPSNVVSFTIPSK